MNWNPHANEIFARALELDSLEEQATYLANACGDDIGLRQLVNKMLESHANVGSFLGVPIVRDFPLLEEPEDHSPRSSSSQIDRFGDYRIIRELGRGGMGIVYEAEQVSLGRRVALKVLPRELVENSQHRIRFEREAKAAAKLHHTNIVPVFGVGEDDGQCYYVMQFIQGQSLDNFLKELKQSVGGQDSPRPTVRAGISRATKQFTPPSDSDAPTLGLAKALQNSEFRSEQAKATSETPGADGLDETVASPSDGPGDSVLSSSNQVVSSDIKHDTQSTSISPSSWSLNLPVGRGDKRHDDSKPTSYWQSVAQIGIQVAEALDYAHGQGVLHRDIKPANLVLDQQGTVWVTDFGLARIEDERGLTQTGDILGTLRYMAPETFKGQANAQSELYSLGLTLYEMLALRPAFDQSSRNVLIEQVMNAEAQPLKELNAEIPNDLCTVIHKAIEKDPKHRYGTAKEFADDLRRFHDDEPIHARQISLVEQTMRWSRRNRGLATALATVSLLISLLSVGSTVAAIGFKKLNARLSSTVTTLTMTANELTVARDQAEQETKVAEQARQDSVTMLADMQTQRGLLAAEQGDSADAAIWFVNAAQLTPHDPDRQEANKLRARNWLDQAMLPVALFDTHNGLSRRLEIQPHGKFVLTLNVGGLSIHNVDDETSLSWPETLSGVNDAAWSPDGQYVAVALVSGEIQIREALDGVVVKSFSYPGSLQVLRWSPNGDRIAIAGSSVQIWNVVDAPIQEADWPHPQPVYGLTFNSAGDQIASTCEDNLVRLFAVGDPSRPAPLFPGVEHLPSSILGVGYRPVAVFFDGDSKLVTASKVFPHWWDVNTGENVTPAYTAKPSCYAIRLVASQDGKWIAATGNDYCLVTRSSGESYAIKHGHHVIDAAFDPRGGKLLTTAMDSKARVWSLPPTDQPVVTMPQLNTFRRCAYSFDGSFVAIGGYTTTTAIWKFPTNEVLVGQVPDWGNSFWRVRQSFDGKIATIGAWHESWSALPVGDNKLGVVRMADGQPVGPTISLDGRLIDSCICGDNQTIAAVCSKNGGGFFSLHDVSSATPKTATIELPQLPVSVAARPNSSHVAVLCRGGKLLVFDIKNGSSVMAVEHDEWPYEHTTTRVMYSPDGNSLVTVTPESRVVVRDAVNGRLRFPPIAPIVENGPLRSLDVSSDSRLIATAVNGKNVVQVWDLQSGQRTGSALPHPGDFIGVFSVRFSHDGRWVLTGHTDGRMRLWDWKTGSLVCPPMQHPDEVHDAQFTSDGKFALAAMRHGTIAVWDLATSKLVAPYVPYPVSEDQSTHSLAVAGMRAIAGADGHPVLNLESLLNPPPMKLQSLQLLAELSTNQVLHLGELSKLERPQWIQRWKTEAMHLSRPTLSGAAREPIASANRSRVDKSRQMSEFDQHLERLTREAETTPKNIGKYYALGNYLAKLGRLFGDN